MRKLWPALQQVAEAHPQQAEIQLMLAQGAVNAVNYYGQSKKLNEMELALCELRKVAQDFPTYQPVLQLLSTAEALARRFRGF